MSIDAVSIFVAIMKSIQTFITNLRLSGKVSSSAATGVTANRVGTVCIFATLVLLEAFVNISASGLTLGNVKVVRAAALEPAISVSAKVLTVWSLVGHTATGVNSKSAFVNVNATVNFELSTISEIVARFTGKAEGTG